MLDQSVYKKRDKLRSESSTLRILSHDSTLEFDKYMKIRMDQDKIYKKWLFYDRVIKMLNKKEPK